MIYWIIGIIVSFWLGVCVMACFAHNSYRKGYKDGNKNGFYEGHDAGYERGYKDGCDARFNNYVSHHEPEIAKKKGEM